MKQQQGIIIVELMITLIISSIILKSMMSINNYIKQTKCHIQSKGILNQLRSLQLKSVVLDSDVLIHTNNHNLVVMMEDRDEVQLTVDQAMSVMINRIYGLGFKSNLNTKFAGSLYLSCDEQEKRITVPVGVTLLQLK